MKNEKAMEDLTQMIMLDTFLKDMDGSAYDGACSMFREDGLVQVLLKKIEAMNLPVEVSIPTLWSIGRCSRGPGIAQLILRDVLVHAQTTEPGKKVITIDDFVSTFPMEFPICYDDEPPHEVTEIGKKYEKLWDEQKTYSFTNKSFLRNAVDTSDWWSYIYR